MPEILVHIDPQGEVKVEASGVAGSGCQALTRALEQQLGSTTADVKKPEFYQQQNSKNRQQAGQQ